MRKIIYTKAEKQEITKSLNVIIDDLRELWKISQSSSIEVDIPDSNLSLKVSNAGIILKEFHPERLILPSFSRRYMELNTPIGRIKGTLPYQLSLVLVKEYTNVRQRFEYLIQRDIKEKEFQLYEVNHVSNEYGRTVDIELEVPPVQNIYSLDIKKENGKNIGTVNLGKNTVRIITEGDILVTNKYQQNKEKIKSVGYDGKKKI